MIILLPACPMGLQYPMGHGRVYSYIAYSYQYVSMSIPSCFKNIQKIATHYLRMVKYMQHFQGYLRTQQGKLSARKVGIEIKCFNTLQYAITSTLFQSIYYASQTSHKITLPVRHVSMARQTPLHLTAVQLCPSTFTRILQNTS